MSNSTLNDADDNTIRNVRHADINRRITSEELEIVEDAARRVGIWRFAHEC